MIPPPLRLFSVLAQFSLGLLSLFILLTLGKLISPPDEQEGRTDSRRLEELPTYRELQNRRGPLRWAGGGVGEKEVKWLCPHWEVDISSG